MIISGQMKILSLIRIKISRRPLEPSKPEILIRMWSISSQVFTFLGLFWATICDIHETLLDTYQGSMQPVTPRILVGSGRRHADQLCSPFQPQNLSVNSDIFYILSMTVVGKRSARTWNKIEFTDDNMRCRVTDN
jgi:hypothetical protein